MAQVKAQIFVSCTVRRDDATNSFVSHCPELKLYSAGNTELEALEAIRSAVSLFLRWAYERKSLGGILIEMGMHYASDPAPLRLGSEANVGSALSTQSIPIQVPFFLLASAQAQGGCA